MWNRPGNAANWAEVMAKETSFGGGAPSAITSQHPQILKNVHYSQGRPLEDAQVRSAIEGAKARLGDSGRIVIRP